ncbi:MAG: hypothetical protein ACK4UN_09250 [Limisphaerales bacterium]
MKAKVFPLVGFAIIALFLAGCATQRIDWNARVGHYTYDQAVLEMGPPDRAAKIADGTLVAEWLTYRGSRGGYTYSYSPYYWSPAPFYDPPTPDRFIRLTFDPEGRLRDWRRVAR